MEIHKHIKKYIKLEKTNGHKLENMRNSLNKEDNLFFLHTKNSKLFVKNSKAEENGTLSIMTYGDQIIYMKADFSVFTNMPASKFNYNSGTFEKKWDPIRKTIVLTPNESNIRKIRKFEMGIQGMDIRKMNLLVNETGEIIVGSAKIKIIGEYGGPNEKDVNIRDSNTTYSEEFESDKN